MLHKEKVQRLCVTMVSTCRTAVGKLVAAVSYNICKQGQTEC